MLALNAMLILKRYTRGCFPWFPLTTGQIRMLLEGNTCDASAFYQDFGLTPITFKEGLARYLT